MPFAPAAARRDYFGFGDLWGFWGSGALELLVTRVRVGIGQEDERMRGSQFDVAPGSYSNLLPNPKDRRTSDCKASKGSLSSDLPLRDALVLARCQKSGSIKIASRLHLAELWSRVGG